MRVDVDVELDEMREGAGVAATVGVGHATSTRRSRAPPRRRAGYSMDDLPGRPVRGPLDPIFLATERGRPKCSWIVGSASISGTSNFCSARSGGKARRFG